MTSPLRSSCRRTHAFSPPDEVMKSELEYQLSHLGKRQRADPQKQLSPGMKLKVYEKFAELILGPGPVARLVEEEVVLSEDLVEAVNRNILKTSTDADKALLSRFRTQAKDPLDRSLFTLMYVIRSSPPSFFSHPDRSTRSKGVLGSRRVDRNFHVIMKSGGIDESGKISLTV